MVYLCTGSIGTRIKRWTDNAIKRLKLKKSIHFQKCVNNNRYTHKRFFNIPIWIKTKKAFYIWRYCRYSRYTIHIQYIYMIKSNTVPRKRQPISSTFNPNLLWTSLTMWYNLLKNINIEIIIQIGTILLMFIK